MVGGLAVISTKSPSDTSNSKVIGTGLLTAPSPRREAALNCFIVIGDAPYAVGTVKRQAPVPESAATDGVRRRYAAMWSPR